MEVKLPEHLGSYAWYRQTDREGWGEKERHIEKEREIEWEEKEEKRKGKVLPTSNSPLK